MKNIKCPRCGMVNFAGVPRCKRCQHEFPAPPVSAAEPEEQPVTTTPDEQRPLLPALSGSQPPPAAKSFEPLPEYEVEATPIGGWLIVFALGLGLSLGLAALGIQKYVTLFSMKEFHELTTKGSRLYISGLSSGAVMEFIWICLAAASSVILLIRLFRRSSSFPRLAISILSLNIVVAFFDYLTVLNIRNELAAKLKVVYGSGQVPEILPSYFGLLVLCAIAVSGAWIGYFLTSRRVESTFIH